NQRTDMRSVAKQLKVPLAQVTTGIERRLEHALRGGVGARNFEGNRFDACGLIARRPAAGQVAQMNGACGYDAPQHRFECAPKQRDVVVRVEAARERREQLAETEAMLAAAGCARSVNRAGRGRLKGHIVAPRWHNGY